MKRVEQNYYLNSWVHHNAHIINKVVSRYSRRTVSLSPRTPCARNRCWLPTHKKCTVAKMPATECSTLCSAFSPMYRSPTCTEHSSDRLNGISNLHRSEMPAFRCSRVLKSRLISSQHIIYYEIKIKVNKFFNQSINQ